MRPLTDDEIQLVEHLVRLASLFVDVAALRAEPMNDGDMGSLRFASTTEGPNFSTSVAEVTFEDEDGVPVSAALYVDQSGALFELDVWKVDFSPLLRWPEASDLARSKAT